jgi:hypothetical protein
MGLLSPAIAGDCCFEASAHAVLLLVPDGPTLVGQRGKDVPLRRQAQRPGRTIIFIR